MKVGDKVTAVDGQIGEIEEINGDRICICYVTYEWFDARNVELAEEDE